ncbi:Snf7-domain-containing protein [Piromyces finnis]|uniref:Snf7-domain-containing protein n=1 Tax=Piromyces finnis TaxID=1754191 RepID=A0A1Y1V0H3_9FUNG|nr:Snf7-domain-containing protein [Piromyces finnis]|eukprot:ORX43769.1 Snf7-domain-containing protein [Piromyces finnis]
MGSSSSKPKSKKITSQDKAILDLKIQRDKLTQYQKKIQVVLDREYEIAKINLKNGDKKKALLALKKRKYQEQLIEKIDTQLMNVEELVNNYKNVEMTRSIEYAVVEKDIIDKLKIGNETLTKLNNEMSIEKVEDLMNETAEAVAYQNEISELLSGAFTVEDEEAIEDELNQLIEEEINNKLPEVPNTKLPKVEVEEEPESEKEEVKAERKPEPELVTA